MTFSLIGWLRDLFFGAREGTSPFPPGTGPKRLLILRHGEKTGLKGDQGLSDGGVARAQKLAAYIPKTFGKPDFIIAASTSKKSSRPVDTIAPLAVALRLDIEATLDDEEIDELLEMLEGDARFKGKFGVISWRHATLPELIDALGAPAGSFPSPWDDTVYDLCIEMTFGGATPNVRQIKQPF